MHNIVEPLLPLAADIDVLRPMEGNARKGDVAAVKRSLEAFGQRKPIVASEDGTISAGHHIHAAAVGLGWTEVAVVFLPDDEARARAFALADNRTSDLGTYDHEMLLSALIEVRDEDQGLLDATSYTTTDIEDLMEFLAGPKPQGEGEGEGEGSSGEGGGLTCPACGFELGA